MSAESTGAEPTGALNGLRILDLTGKKGAYCGQLLANLGAEVILMEPPGGDPMRREGPFKSDASHPEGSISFAAYHTNKRAIVLDLETSEGQQTLRALVRAADVLIEDRPVGYLGSLGLGYDQLETINPALVMASISGFGLSGPYRDFKATNIVAFAMGGLMISAAIRAGRPWSVHATRRIVWDRSMRLLGLSLLSTIATPRVAVIM